MIDQCLIITITMQINYHYSCYANQSSQQLLCKYIITIITLQISHSPQLLCISVTTAIAMQIIHHYNCNANQKLISFETKRYQDLISTKIFTVWFGLVSLLNGMSTSMDYLMPKPSL